MNITRPSSSFVVAVAALCLALGGGVGYAAGGLPKHSVGVKQLKKGAVTAKSIKAGAVSGEKVADGSLTGADLAANTLTGAQVDESTLAIPAKPGRILLTGADFAPRNSALPYDTNGYADIHNSGAATGTGYLATVHLPAGATVTSARVFYQDLGAADDLEAYYGRVDPTTGAGSFGSPYHSSGAVAGAQTFTLTPLALTGSQLPVLLVYIPPGSAYALFGAEVDYQ